MKTMKLAVSVYALTLVLGANNALGTTATPSSTPSCEPNKFEIGFLCYDRFYNNTEKALYSSAGLTDGYAYYGQEFTFPNGENLEDCKYPGYKLVGWKWIDNNEPNQLPNCSYEIPLENATVKIGEDYTNIFGYGNENNTDIAKFTFATVWEPLTGTVELKIDDNTPLFNGSLTVAGNDLYKENNSFCESGTLKPVRNGLVSNELNPDLEGTPIALTGITKKGYDFQGFSKDGRALTEDELRVTCPQEISDAVTNKPTTWNINDISPDCPLINADGEAIAQDIWAPVTVMTGNKLTLKAMYYPWTYNVEYRNSNSNFNGNLPTGERTCTQNGESENDGCIISFDGMTAKYQRFDGWQVSILKPGSDDPEKVEGMVLKEGEVTNLTEIFGELLNNHNLQNGDTIVLKATWTDYTLKVNFYKERNSGSPINTEPYVFNLWGTKDKIDLKLSEWVDGVEGKSLRGFVISPDEDYGDVSTDAKSLDCMYEGFSGCKTYLIVNRDGIPTIVHESYNNINGAYLWKDDPNAEYLKKMIESGDAAETVNVYGVWADNCEPDSYDSTKHVAKCQLFINGSGTVNYVNMCDSGYNLTGDDNTQQEAGDNIGEGSLVNGFPEQ